MTDIFGVKKGYTICNKCGQIRAYRFQSDYCDFHANKENQRNRKILIVHEALILKYLVKISKRYKEFRLIDSNIPQVTAVSDNTRPLLSKTFGRILGSSSTSIKPLP